jgi:hypothetical protein
MESMILIAQSQAFFRCNRESCEVANAKHALGPLGMTTGVREQGGV